MSKARRLLEAARSCETALAQRRLVALAAVRGQRLVSTAAPSARLSLAVRMVSVGRGRSELRIGRRSILEPGVLLRLGDGAILDIGDDVTIRSGCILNVSGTLTLRGSNLLSWNSVVHCADAVDFRPFAGTGEMVTVVDGTHFRRSHSDHWYHNSTTAPVTIGANSWLAAKATVTQGVTVGRGVTVGAGSVVTRDVPDDCLVAGSPARVIRTDITPSE